MANSKIVNTPSQAIPQSGTTHTQRTISGTAAAIVNWTLNANTTHVFVQFTGANARVTLDGSTNPTTSLGFQYPDGSTAYWTRQIALSAKAIRDDSTDVVCEIQELNFL
jgi:hypothetical protein